MFTVSGVCRFARRDPRVTSTAVRLTRLYVAHVLG